MFKKIKSFFMSKLGAITTLSFACMSVAASGHCAMDLSTITVDLSSVFTLAVTIVGALVSLIAVRKVIKLSNRS